MSFGANRRSNILVIRIERFRAFDYSFFVNFADYAKNSGIDEKPASALGGSAGKLGRIIDTLAGGSMAELQDFWKAGKFRQVGKIHRGGRHPRGSHPCKNASPGKGEAFCGWQTIFLSEAGLELDAGLLGTDEFRDPLFNKFLARLGASFDDLA